MLTSQFLYLDFLWCGVLINRETLSVSYDYSLWLVKGLFFYHACTKKKTRYRFTYYNSSDGVVLTTAGEQKVIDTWDLTSLDRAWCLLFKLNIWGTVSDLVNVKAFHLRTISP